MHQQYSDWEDLLQNSYADYFAANNHIVLFILDTCCEFCENNIREDLGPTCKWGDKHSACYSLSKSDCETVRQPYIEEFYYYFIAEIIISVFILTHTLTCNQTNIQFLEFPHKNKLKKSFEYICIF